VNGNVEPRHPTKGQARFRLSPAELEQIRCFIEKTDIDVISDEMRALDGRRHRPVPNYPSREIH
jgi:hypothetical protein